MKKFFKKSIVLLCLLGTGVGMISCDGDTVQSILNEIVGIITNNNVQSKEYAYVGTLNAQLLVSDGKGGYTTPGEGAAFSNTQLPVTEKVTTVTTGDKMTDGSVQNEKTTSSRAADIVLPAFPVDGVSMSEVSFADLDCTIDNKNVRALSVGNSTTGTGTLTVSGQTYDVSSVYLEGTFTETNYVISVMSIYFGDKYVINIRFSGQASAN